MIIIFEVVVIYHKTFVFIIVLIFVVACSSTKESTKQTKVSADEVYVFDDVSDVPDIDTTLTHEAVEVTVKQKVQPTPPPVTQSQQSITTTVEENSYAVQIGAFSTRDKAENFMKNIQNSIDYPLSIKFVEKTGFYTVRLTSFKNRKEAEKVRNNLWNNSKFSDAFIVPPSK